MLTHEVEGLWLSARIAGPMYEGVGDALFRQVTTGTSSSIDVVTVVTKDTCGIQHRGLLLCTTRRKEDTLLRDAVTYGEHGLHKGIVRVVAKATNFTR